MAISVEIANFSHPVRVFNIPAQGMLNTRDANFVGICNGGSAQKTRINSCALVGGGKTDMSI